jgi:predicted amidohydrolase YtcJ
MSPIHRKIVLMPFTTWAKGETMMEADIVLVDCNVLTMNPFQPHAEAIAIKKNKIIKVGTKKEIKPLIKNKTKVIKLDGLTVLPGLIDTHLHIADFGRFLTWLDLKDVKSITKMKSMVKESAQKNPKGRWILGQGWDQTSFPEQRTPNRQDLDEAAPNYPVTLYHKSGCMCVVNSKALQLAEITKETQDPDGGKIEHNPETGEPTGGLYENAMSLVWKVIPEPDEEEVFEATALACRKVVEAGVTSVQWIVSSLSEIKLIQRLRLENKLPIRVFIIYPVDILDHVSGLRQKVRLDDDWMRIGGVKIFLDGSLAERTAALKEPYSDCPTTKGKLLYTKQDFSALVDRLHKADYGIVLHAMGDRAIERVIETLEQALKETSKQNHRYRIEQAAVLNKELIKRLKKLEVNIAVQPCTIISEFTAWSAVERLGKERARWLYPLASLTKEGIKISGGSDCPMEKISPFLGMQAVVTRQFFPEEQISVDDALRMYTVNAAFVSFDEKIKGSVEQGKLADLTVISDDPRAVSPSNLADIEVRMTFVDGKIVFQK